MHSRVIITVVLLASLVFALPACDGTPVTPANLDQASARATEPETVDSVFPTPTPEYLTAVIPPCTPAAGSSVDPCEPGWRTHGSSGAIVERIPDEPYSVQHFLNGAGDFVPHIVVRGTYLPGTVRCAPTDFLPRPYLGQDTYGGLNGESLLLCYADVRVNEYILGTGPPTITVVVWFLIFWDSYEESVEAPKRGLVQGGVSFSPRGEIQPIVGREEIMFIGPTLSASIEAFEVFSTWGIERRNDGTVVAVHPYKGYYGQEHSDLKEMELLQFKQAVSTAQAARVASNDGRVFVG